jgi:hypothetical protein
MAAQSTNDKTKKKDKPQIHKHYELNPSKTSLVNDVP